MRAGFGHRGNIIRGALISALAGAALAATSCGTGEQLGIGPVLGYASGRGLSAGWEASGGPFATTGNGDAVPTDGSLIGRFSVGTSWRPGAGPTVAREWLTYADWEPWFLVGGTAGLARSSTGPAWRPVLGVWEAAPYVAGGQTDPSSVLPRCGPCLTLSVALGWRWALDGGELYLAPKVGFLNGVSKPTPFSRYPD
jgi:hypothetical protein